MNISRPVPRAVDGVSFSVLSPDEIRRQSVLAVTNPQLFDASGLPNSGGLYDPALGVCSKDAFCSTCAKGSFSCNGHFGHIDLPLPVYNPLFFPALYSILRSTCFFCYHLRFSRSQIILCRAKLILLSHGHIDQVLELDNWFETQEQENGSSPSKLISAIVAKYGKLLKEPISSKDKSATTQEISVRRAVLADIWRRMVAAPKCTTCSAHKVTLRQDSCAKIFMAPFSKKIRQAHLSANMHFSEAKVFSEHAVVLGAKKAKSKAYASPPSKRSRDMLDDDLDLDNAKKGAFDWESTETSRNEESAASSTSQIFLHPLLVKRVIELVWHFERPFFDLVYNSTYAPPMESLEPHFNHKFSAEGEKPPSSPHIFFFEAVPVPPSRFRPISQLGEQTFEHPQNSTLIRIILESQNITAQIKNLKAMSNEDNSSNEQGTYTAAVFSSQSKASKGSKDSTAVVLANIGASWMELQGHVNALIDSNIKNPSRSSRSTSAATNQQGIRQLLERKEGLFRMNMMGKRVNYSARSVISPDPWIEPGEIGIPSVFATRLSFPEPVTGHNLEKLMLCVMNGPHVWPGATHVQTEDGRLLSLDGMTREQRKSVAASLAAPPAQRHLRAAKDTGDGSSRSLAAAVLSEASGVVQAAVNKKVLRHLENGDTLLINRQPTLHKPSIMAHRARVLPDEKTLRLHYANCNTYNADFDGDEMNVHFPQNDIARAEATFIANTENQYLSPTDGSPLRGLIQDHVVTGVIMCLRDNFLTRSQYHNLLIGTLPQQTMDAGRILLMRPAIVRPTLLWTGKQVISTLLLNLCRSRAPLNFSCKARVGAAYWGRAAREEAQVNVCCGELVTGVLDKSQVGASSSGLVHSVYEAYGADVAGQLLGALGRLFSKYLQSIGFTCRMDDLMLSPKGDADRTSLLQKAERAGKEVAFDYTRVNPDAFDSEDKLCLALEVATRDNDKLAGLDAAMKACNNAITSTVISNCLPSGLLRLFPDNGMQMMTVTGAKGSNVNVSQISCCLGQQELEGRRVPVMISGKTLPCFQPYDPSSRAGGYIAGRFLTGIRPYEYFFHCMAGREGLIDTAVKTSRSGYLQRCLMKHLEGLRVHYDGSVRNSDGSVLQFMYGEDGLDVTKQAHLREFGFCARNAPAFLARLKPDQISKYVDAVSVPAVLKRRRKEDKRLSRGKRVKLNHSEYTDSVDEILQNSICLTSARDPLLSQMSPYKSLGCVSDAFEEELSRYIQSNPDGILSSEADMADNLMESGEDRRRKRRRKRGDDDDDESVLQTTELCRSTLMKKQYGRALISKDEFEALMHLKYMRSLVDPGESVGVLAAQSIGEPSTQMTLNTFHFAGFGAKNVTLGIPRLREIIMTASSKIKTPTMTLTMRPGVPQDKCESFCKRVSRLTLASIIRNFTITESLVDDDTGSRMRRQRIRLNFFPPHVYRHVHHVTPELLLQILQFRFVSMLEHFLQKEFRRSRIGVEEEGDTISEAQREELLAVSKSARTEVQSDDDENLDKVIRKSKKKSISREGDFDDDDDDDDDDDSDFDDGDAGQADASSSKYASRRKERSTYSDDDEGEENDANEIDFLNENADEKEGASEESKSKATAENDNEENDNDEEGNLDDDAVKVGTDEFKTVWSLEEQASVRQTICSRSKRIADFAFDYENGEFAEFEIRTSAARQRALLMPLVERTVRKTVIRELGGITRCFPVIPEGSDVALSGVQQVATDGVNLRGMWAYPGIVDLNCLATNDISSVLRVYGVEAARATIINEIANVFGVYGISVDRRHLTLVADYMTFEGNYRAFSRLGLGNDSSPFLKMTFETTCSFLTQATLHREHDTLGAPSSCIVVGQPARCGSNVFSIAHPLKT